MLGNVYVSLGDGQAARQNYAKCFELKDRRLTQEENFRAAATNHMYMTGNLEKALAALVLYKQAYPRSTVASNLLGVVTCAWAERRGSARVPAGN